MAQPLNILWLKTGPLHPPDTGGKLRTYNMLRALAKKHQVTYLALCPPSTNPEILKKAGEYSALQYWIPWKEAAKYTPKFYLELLRNVFSPLPYAVAKYHQPLMTGVIQGRVADDNIDVIVCDFLFPAINVPLGPGRPALPLVLFQHNVESMIWRRWSESASGVKKLYLSKQWRRMRKYEHCTAGRFDAIVGVSAEDCQEMRRWKLTNVLGSVPTGVDIEYFKPPNIPRKPASIVFSGSMDWLPNVDSVAFFGKDIWPDVKRLIPSAEWTIVGRNPAPSVRKLAETDPAIKVTGTVDDVRPYLHGSEIMVVPLRIGGGTRIKIFEAMAAGIPIVSTRVGAEGLPVQDGEHLLIADEPSAFAAAVARLSRDAELRARLADNARRLVTESYSWESAADVFADYLETACVNYFAPAPK